MAWRDWLREEDAMALYRIPQKCSSKDKIPHHSPVNKNEVWNNEIEVLIWKNIKVRKSKRFVKVVQLYNYYKYIYIIIKSIYLYDDLFLCSIMLFIDFLCITLRRDETVNYKILNNNLHFLLLSFLIITTLLTTPRTSQIVRT